MSEVKNNVDEVKLIIQFSQEAEVSKIKRDVNKWVWYNENGYQVQLPSRIIDGLNNGSVFNDQDIAKMVSDEFVDLAYEEKGRELQSQWAERGKNFIEKLNSLGIPLQPEYKIILTKYGCGGSYNLPNLVIVKFAGGTKKAIMDVIFHEIIHLTIQPLIEKYGIDHWTKERLVDLIFNKFFPENLKLQRDPVNFEKINEIFNSFFPNIEKIISEISELR